ncbi:MAG: hypothetical protein H0W61_16450, partial [Bacteroidetes bacterium]|nr:hypothetical protein [Bacteroidota bacterium]
MRKNLLSAFISIITLSSFTLLSQQQDPIKVIGERLMRERPHHYSPDDANVISGSMIVNANSIGKPTGTPVSQFTDAQLQASCHFFGGDTLNGFNFIQAKQTALNDGYKMVEEFKANMYQQQFAYVQSKYNIAPVRFEPAHADVPSQSKLNGAASTFASACNNVDFEDGNLGGWTGVSGYNTNSNAALTIPNSSFTTAVTSTDQNIYSCSDINLITTAYGNDPVGGFNGKDPNGGSYSIRVGGFNINTSNGYGFGCSGSHWWGGPLNYYSNGEYLEKTITVSAANSLLSFDYAVILNDGGHSNGNQPYFHVFVTNSAGAVLSTCTQYYVQALAGGPPAGFTNSGYVNTYDNSVLYYKNWTSNSINLTPYIGSTVKIRFVAAGCTAGAHMAWAYVDAICSSANIVASNPSPCVGQTVVLTAPPVAGGSYLWSGPGIVGATNTQNVTVNATGTYSVVVTPSQGVGCAYTLTSPITFNPNPSLSASATNSLNCTSTTAQINITTNASSPLYSTSGPGVIGGAGSANVTVNTGGTYNILVTNGATGCSTSGAITITQNTTPPPVSASASGSLNCITTSATLNGGPGSGVTYAWTGPGGFTSSSQNPSVTTGGNYNLTVTSTFNGCQATAGPVNVAQNTTPPVASAAASGSLNCVSTSINLNGSPGSGVTYAWTGPAGFTSSLQNPSGITTGGTYNLVVTSTSNGCSSAASSTTIPQNTTPPVASAAASGSLNCTNISATLFGNPSSGVNYSWTGPSGFTSNAQNPTINLGGTYNLVVTSTTNGCSSSISSTTVPQSTTAVSASALPSGSLNCNVNSVNATITTTASPVSYTTTGPGITSGANSANLTVNAGGLYSYTVTNTTTLCKTVGTFSVTQNTTPPTALASANGSLNCTNASVALNGSPASGVTYAWTGPGGFTSSSQNPVITTGGSYNLVVTSTTNGCTSAVSSTSIPQNTTAVTVSAVPSGSLNCTVTSVNIALSTTASPASYTLTGPGVTAGANSANPTVNTGGVYNYTVANSSSQCQTTGAVSIAQNTTPPSASINPPAQINCTASAVTLVGNPTSGVTYTWSGPAGFTSNGGNPSVSNAGSYNLSITSTSNNCTATAATNVTSNFSVSATATVNNVITCDPNSLSINLFASPSGMNYTWTASNGGMVTSGQNANNATGYGPGTYSLSLYNPTNGCTASATVSPVSNTVQPAPAVASSGTVTCSSATINLSTSNVGLTYTWSPPSGSSVSSPNASVTAASGPGTYTLYVLNPNTSCTNSNVISVTTQTTKPNPSITTNPTPTITCNNGTVTLNGAPSSGATYTWSGPGVSGTPNNAAVSVTSPGVYSLAVTSTSNGCSSAAMATVNVSINTASPAITMGSNQTIPCSPATVQITSTVSPGTATVLWTGPNVCAGATSTTATACAPGVYTVTATNPSNGCNVKSTLTVNPSPGLNVNVTNTGTIYCNPASVQVIASATPATNNT